MLSASFLQQLPVVLDLVTHAEALVGVAAAQCLAQLVSQGWERGSGGWVVRMTECRGAEEPGTRGSRRLPGGYKEEVGQSLQHGALEKVGFVCLLACWWLLCAAGPPG
jgi:hypothetical protein